jgi:hypothetical protein
MDGGYTCRTTRMLAARLLQVTDAAQRHKAQIYKSDWPARCLCDQALGVLVGIVEGSG